MLCLPSCGCMVQHNVTLCPSGISATCRLSEWHYQLARGLLVAVRQWHETFFNDRLQSTEDNFQTHLQCMLSRAPLGATRDGGGFTGGWAEAHHGIGGSSIVPLGSKPTVAKFKTWRHDLDKFIETIGPPLDRD